MVAALKHSNVGYYGTIGNVERGVVCGSMISLKNFGFTNVYVGGRSWLIRNQCFPVKILKTVMKHVVIVHSLDCQI